MVAGYFTEDLFLPGDTLDKIDGYSDYAIVRLNYLGSVIWSAQISGELRFLRFGDGDEVNAVASYMDSCFVAGTWVYSSQPGMSFVHFRLSASGGLLDLADHPGVVRSQAPIGLEVSQVIDHPEFGIHLTGRFNDSLQVGDTVLYGPTNTAYLAHLSEDFEVLWARRLGTNYGEREIVVDDDGNVYFLISSMVTLGTDTLTGNTAAGLLALDPAGNFRWRFEPLSPWEPSVSILPSNRIFFQSTYTDGSFTQWTSMIELSANGNTTNQFDYSSDGSAGLSPRQHPAGGLLMLGGFYNDVNFGACGFQYGCPTQVLLKSSDQGVCDWSREVRGCNVWSYGGDVDEAGRIFIAGTFEYQVQVDIDTLYAFDNAHFASYVGAMSSLPLPVPDEATPAGLHLFPDPCNSTLTIAGALRLSEVRIFGPTGQVVMSTTVNGRSGVIDVSVLTSGLYILRVGDMCARFIKQ
ncbi:MAG: T9SS type A sorting domain-containing protein [Flavobacteriales bacterium]|nr:T9SS type A sorting domain-containing protein [Flavobacteriales bacterium]